MFARLGGGIFTKAADVGADLVGKIEAGIPEDDPRNPAVIADNVGDNVGDCAGMAADLFETYAVTAVAVMLLGVAYPIEPPRAVPTRARRHVDPRFRDRHVLRADRAGENAIINALYKSVIVATMLSAIGFIPVTMAFDGDELLVLAAVRAALIGLAITFLLVAITEYYTGSSLGPGQEDRRGLSDRPRDEHHRGARVRHAGDRAAGDRDRCRDRRRVGYAAGQASTGSASQ